MNDPEPLGTNFMNDSRHNRQSVLRACANGARTHVLNGVTRRTEPQAQQRSASVARNPGMRSRRPPQSTALHFAPLTPPSVTLSTHPNHAAPPPACRPGVPRTHRLLIMRNARTSRHRPRVGLAVQSAIASSAPIPRLITLRSCTPSAGSSLSGTRPSHRA